MFSYTTQLCYEYGKTTNTQLQQLLYDSVAATSLYGLYFLVQVAVNYATSAQKGSKRASLKGVEANR